MPRSLSCLSHPGLCKSSLGSTAVLRVNHHYQHEWPDSNVPGISFMALVSYSAWPYRLDLAKICSGRLTSLGLWAFFALILAGCSTPGGQGASSTKPSSPKAAADQRSQSQAKPEGKPRTKPRYDLTRGVGVWGPVKNPYVEISPELSLVEVLLKAEILISHQPREILIHRDQQTHFVNIRKLLRNLENPKMLAGDIVEIRP